MAWPTNAAAPPVARRHPNNYLYFLLVTVSLAVEELTFDICGGVVGAVVPVFSSSSCSWRRGRGGHSQVGGTRFLGRVGAPLMGCSRSTPQGVLEEACGGPCGFWFNDNGDMLVVSMRVGGKRGGAHG